METEVSAIYLGPFCNLCHCIWNLCRLLLFGLYSHSCSTQKNSLRVNKVVAVLLKLHVYHASALRDVKIPPGPRLLILDHIKRYGMIDKKNIHILAFTVPLPDVLYTLQRS